MDQADHRQYQTHTKVIFDDNQVILIHNKIESNPQQSNFHNQFLLRIHFKLKKIRLLYFTKDHLNISSPSLSLTLSSFLSFSLPMRPTTVTLLLERATDDPHLNNATNEIINRWTNRVWVKLKSIKLSKLQMSPHLFQEEEEQGAITWHFRSWVEWFTMKTTESHQTTKFIINDTVYYIPYIIRSTPLYVLYCCTRRTLPQTGLEVIYRRS